MLNDPDSIKERRKNSLLFKPAGQMALFRGLKKATDSGMSLDAGVSRINGIPWEMKDNPMWKDVMIKAGGNIDAGKEAKTLASRLIAHCLTAGNSKDPDLLKDYRKRMGAGAEDENVQLPQSQTLAA